jgi:hypothetical protein
MILLRGVQVVLVILSTRLPYSSVSSLRGFAPGWDDMHNGFAGTMLPLDSLVEFSHSRLVLAD